MTGETTRPYRRLPDLSGPLDEAPTQVVAEPVAFGPLERGGTAPAGIADKLEPAPVAVEQLPAGTKMGRYLVLGHIGSGGLGDVYAAFDSELDRKVAIKLLRPSAYDKSLGDPTQRLLREAQALAKLRHPNVVTVFDVGTYCDEVFVAMEFVEGRTLSQWIREESPSWQAIRDVYLLAGEGLAAAHAAGLVHRDFKLDNVIVGADGRVTVLDFGLARAIGGLDAEDVRTGPVPLQSEDANTPLTSLLDRDVTRASLVLGTPPYMSPELLTGEPATGNTDQFAFCVALFKSLHRRLPFTASTLAEHYEQVVAGKISTKPEDASVPGWFRKVVERGLEADAHRRWPSMGALLHAMVADRRRRRRRLLYVAIAVPLLSVGVAAAAIATRPEATQVERAHTLELAEQARAAAANGYYVFPPSDAPDTPTALTKVVELENLGGAAGKEGKALGQTLRSELSEALARLGDRYYDRPGGPAFAADFYAAAIVFDPNHQRARERVSLTPGQLAELARRAEQGDFTSGELKAAEALAVLAIEDEAARAERINTYFGEGEASSATQPALLEAVLDEDERAVAAAAKEKRAKRRRRGLGVAPLERVPRVPQAKPASTPAGPALENIDAYGQPLAPPAGALPPTEATPTEPAATTPARPDPPIDDDTPARRAKAKAAAKEGHAALGRGDLAEAEKFFNRALASNRRNASALRGMATVHFHRGNHEKALQFAKKAVAVAPKSGRAHAILGDCYLRLLRHDRARQAYEKAVKFGYKAARADLKRIDDMLGR